LIKPLFGGKPDVGLIDNAKTGFGWYGRLEELDAWQNPFPV
jgi:hypothetical protein